MNPRPSETVRKGDALARLFALKERNGLARERHDSMRHRFAERPAQVVAVADGLFVTPPAVAARMAEILALEQGQTILEPSAGTGRLIDAIQALDLGAKITAVEQCQELAKLLFEKYETVSLKVGDFLAIADSLPQFDRVCMNPPFRRGTDVAHIEKALTCCRSGGRLVSLCYLGEIQRRRLEPLADTWEILPRGSFKESGTMADVVLLSIVKT